MQGRSQGFESPSLHARRRTSANFPVDLARDRVAKGWGVVDSVVGDERMIFIPVGGSINVTESNRLYAIWG